MSKQPYLRLISIILCLICLTSGVSCNSGNGPSTDTESTQETTQNSESNETEDTTDVTTEESTQNSESNETEDTTEETTDTEKEPTLMITAPKGEVFPYLDRARKYLEAGSGANVGKKFEYIKNPQVPITVKWSTTDENITHYTVEYATQSDFSDAISVRVDSPDTSLDLYNLYKSTTYHVRVTSYSGDEEIAQSESSFTTTSLGPRVMNIDGIYNVRDLGGYKTSSGETTLQGLLYRGGSLLPADVYESNLTESGKAYMSEVMGIRTEIDFRTPAEAGNDGGSPIPDADLFYVTLGGYADSMRNWKNAYRDLFSILSNESNYPIYMHCTGGADRTGTVSFILNALLGVSELELIQDYEFTSFSIYHLRSTKDGAYKDYFSEFMSTLNSFEGDTLSQKTESFLLSAGVSQLEIDNFKAIMLGKETETMISADTAFTQNIDEEFSISVSGGKSPIKLTMNEFEMPFTVSTSGITVSSESMQVLSRGTVTGMLTLDDGSEIPFSFTYDVYNGIELDEYMQFGENGTIVVNSQSTKVTGIKPVGYGKTVCIRMKSDMPDDSAGGIYVLVGSYGFLLRGGEFRIAQMTSDGTITETARNLGLNYPNTAFNGGNQTLYLCVEIVNEKPVLTVKVGNDNSMQTFTYTYDSQISNEIASEDARVTFSINSSYVTSLTVYNTDAWNQ
ncbi:MAG: hypothetical protein E7592_03170 [Ruminococcaceae bacterium]|nr:hypothetical protein [Oscillospiraceae bacterium]